MDEKMKECLYLIQWNGGGQHAVTSGFQIEAIRHSEKKWYGGEPSMRILHEATLEDLAAYPPVDDREKEERDRCLKCMCMRKLASNN